MAEGLDVVRGLADPVGAGHRVLDAAERHDHRARAVPLGVVGVIYESRPNVTADAGALTLKAGNAVILRGGSDSFRSSRAIHAALAQGLARGQPAGGGDLARADARPRRRRHDAARPRRRHRRASCRAAARAWSARVQSEARVPVFAHLEGVCHVYVDKAADLDMAKTIVLNAKMRRTGVCGAAETLLVDRAARGDASASRWSRCCSTPAARCAAMPPCRRPTRA